MATVPQLTATQPSRFARSGMRGQVHLRLLMDRLMAGLVYACAFSCVAVLITILAYIMVHGLPALNLDFFIRRPLPYGEVGGGVAPALLGSLAIVGVAALMGVPVGIGTAVYLSEFGRGHFAQLVRFTVDIIAGIPSIVIGVFVWAFLVRHVVGQYNGLAGSVALAIIMVPIVTRTVEEVLRLVPDTYREACLALGIPKWKTIMAVVVPTAKSGVVTGVILSMARAGGETAPLLLTTLGNQFFSFNFLAPMAALPVQIYNYAVAPYDDWHTKAWGSALVLIMVVGLLSFIARQMTRSSLPER